MGPRCRSIHGAIILDRHPHSGYRNVVSGLLDGIRVLEVANWLAAPAAAALLADLGADVIKVEPHRGDPWRGLRWSGDEANYSFEQDNRGKRGMALDLGHPKAKEIVHRIAGNVDVFVTNLLPRRRRRFGLTYDDLKPLNSRLIYLSFTGYGERGPKNDMLGMDFGAFWARSGIMGLMGWPGEPPILQRGGMGDHTTSLGLLAGVLGALYHRERSGEGQEVSSSLFGTALWVIGTDLQRTLVTGRGSERRPYRHENKSPITNWYLTKDDKWLILENPNPVPYWRRTCRALGLSELEDVPEYSTVEGLQEHCVELNALFDKIFATKTREEWGALLDEQQVIWAPIQDLTEVAEDPQASAIGALASLKHPEYGDYRTINLPVKFSASEDGARGPAPETGQHTEEALLEYGYSWGEIEGLRDEGVIP